MRAPNWGRSATNALEVLYTANWRWPAIAVHVSAVDGVERTAYACQRRARDCGMIDRARMRNALTMTQYDKDIEDMAVLDYSAPQMATALEVQYGRRFHASWVYKRLAAGNATSFKAWRQRAAARKRKRISEGRRIGLRRKAS